MKKKKEEQLCLFQPSWQELLSWDGMRSIAPQQLNVLMNKFFIKNKQKDRTRCTTKNTLEL